MFEKEIILKEQLAARCLFQCSPARKLPANAGTFGYLRFAHYPRIFRDRFIQGDFSVQVGNRLLRVLASQHADRDSV
jgi:hypothetical protein